ncbi:MAG TPA: class I SAM-dependent methyltransferase [Pyrinomonadaceae bacterium]|nr:class I SAM-dependent methyltransferase [Pyrinomonadaceae bacterium]
MWDFISTRVTQFSYFDRQLGHPRWRGRKVLDFGGNVGGFLLGADGNVAHEDYWCLDLNRGAIEQGSRAFPLAHFHHYNRYSAFFNPDGVRRLPVPDLGVRFDIILAFSVFTHTHRSETVELVGQLRKRLAPGGVLAFTFCDPSYDRSLSAPELPPGTDVRKNLEWQLPAHPSLDIDGLVETAKRSDWCVLVDDRLHVEPGDELCEQEREGKPGESYCSYFTVDYMRSLFPDAKILPPVSPEWQHCCVLTNDES